MLYSIYYDAWSWLLPSYPKFYISGTRPMAVHGQTGIGPVLVGILMHGMPEYIMEQGGTKRQ